MTYFISLTAEQADTVRGPSREDDATLDPTELKDGTWVLPLSVLSDPAHSEYHQLFRSCPVRSVSPADVVADEDEDL